MLPVAINILKQYKRLNTSVCWYEQSSFLDLGSGMTFFTKYISI